MADALQSFAGWFCNLTFDDMGVSGSARRIHVAAAAFDAIVDWVGLHRTQQFASDISGQMAELVEQSQALDDEVMSAFLVERTPNSVTYRTSAFVPQAKQEAIEDGIQSVASLAGHLGIRLQRIALMVGSQPTEASGKTGGKPRGRQQNDEALARDLLAGWRAFEPEEGRKTKPRYLSQRADVRAVKTEDARRRKIALLRVALDSALHLHREKAKQKRRLRG